MGISLVHKIQGRLGILNSQFELFPIIPEKDIYTHEDCILLIHKLAEKYTPNYQPRVELTIEDRSVYTTQSFSNRKMTLGYHLVLYLVGLLCPSNVAFSSEGKLNRWFNIVISKPTEFVKIFNNGI